MSSPRQQKGFDAETQALHHLQAAGLTLIARQWTCRFGEIDLIMREGSTVVFVEVRQRRHSAFGGALESLSRAKLAKVQRASELYLAESSFRGLCRIDAILIDGQGDLVWMRNITG